MFILNIKKLAVLLIGSFFSRMLFATNNANNVESVKKNLKEINLSVRERNFEQSYRLMEEITSLIKIDNNIVDTEGRFGRTSLSTASKIGDISLLNFFIENGANINHRDTNDHTPLMLSLLNCEPEASQFLILKGADKGIVSSFGETALSIAKDRRDSCLDPKKKSLFVSVIEQLENPNVQKNNIYPIYNTSSDRSKNSVMFFVVRTMSIFFLLCCFIYYIKNNQTNSSKKKSILYYINKYYNMTIDNV